MKAKRNTISQQLRDAILNAEISRYELSKRSGVGQGSLSRFVHEQQSLTLASIDKIGDVLKLHIESKREK